MTVLVQAAELADALATRSERLVILDVRWALGAPRGHPAYLRGHIPGAVFVDLESELAAHGEPTDGRHPLPDPIALQRVVARWGINDDDLVVAYDDTGGLAAARAWWLLRWAGHGYVRLLDGGLAAWVEGGGTLATNDVRPVPGSWQITTGSSPTLSADDVLPFLTEGVLLDARAAERYRGEVEPIDPVAGHIPGATSAPTVDNLSPDGRFLSADALRQRFEALGVTPDAGVAVYCGSGVTAAHEVAALTIAGFRPALYPGSWSQWSNQGRAVATGDEPDGSGAGDEHP